MSPEITEWAIDKLKPNPLQARFFAEMTPVELRQLADSMKVNGQEPLLILPDGTIISGHQRWAAAKLLGWTAIKVIVCEDLANNPVEAERVFIEQNAIRRQLTRTQMAQCALRLKELAEGGKVSPWKRAVLGQRTRDYIGSVLKISGREADRLVRLLWAPKEVQAACEAKKLSLVLAGRVAGLPPETRETIAAELREQGFEHAREIVEKFLPQKKTSPRGAGLSFQKVLEMLRTTVPELEAHLKDVGVRVDDVQILDRASNVFSRLGRRAKARHEKNERDFARTLTTLNADPSSSRKPKRK